MTRAPGSAFLETMPDPMTRAAAVIPSGASTGSKRPEALFGSDFAGLPTHFKSARGCRLVTAEGRELIDCTMALGAVAIGYADADVVAAVSAAAARGNVAGLSHVLEIEIAERLVELIPCAERVRFLKTGAEGVAAAVRIARAHTTRDRVLGCGYFGWLGWWSAADGVPLGECADFESIPFDDADALERAARAAGDSLAAIVIEPVVERAPGAEWLAAARRACDAVGAVLIFDEVKTGFRVRTGGYQSVAGVLPDLAVFGKAMANGFPLSAVVGNARVMSAANRTWISSTLAGETTALAAARAVLDRHAREDVCAALESTGATMMRAMRGAIDDAAVGGVTVEGIPQMWLTRFAQESDRATFQRAMLDQGVLVKRGAYNFPALAHDASALHAVECAAQSAMRIVRERQTSPAND